MRLPYRQRFPIVLNELGAGLAGRGQDLNALIRRADPALQQTDRVLKQLADENTTLSELARDSDRALAPLARDRRHLSGFIQHATTVAEATAARRADIEGSIQRLPRFLRELKPTMQDLGALSDQMTPVLTDLGTAAPSLSRFVRELGPFSRSANRSLTSLGKATDVGGPVLQRARPVVLQLKSFAHTANPVSRNLDALTASLDRTGGIERLMDYVFFQMTAINGFDSLGHYLRAGLIVNNCATYVTDPTSGCAATYTSRRSIHSSAAGASDPTLARESVALRNALDGGVSSVARRGATAKTTPTQVLGNVLHGLLNLAPSARAQRRTAALRGAAAGDRSQALGGASGRDEALLRYLMGSDG